MSEEQKVSSSATPTHGGSMNAAYSPGENTGADTPGRSGNTDDPNSATSRSEDNSDTAGEASVRDVESSSIAVGSGAGQITTDEASDERRGERSVGAETPSDGTLG